MIPTPTGSAPDDCPFPPANAREEIPSAQTVKPAGHTKGPWDDGIHHAVTRGGRTYAYVGGNSIVSVACVPLGVEGYGREEGEANARLISAAPDLLDVLQLIQRFNTCGPGTDALINRAISKATGSPR